MNILDIFYQEGGSRDLVNYCSNKLHQVPCCNGDSVNHLEVMTFIASVGQMNSQRKQPWQSSMYAGYGFPSLSNRITSVGQA